MPSSSSTCWTVSSRKRRSWETTSSVPPKPHRNLEPGQAVEVEVVRRLVEQQHGRRREQDAGEQHARRLAAREPRERRAAVEVRDVEAPQHLVEARLERPAAERVEARPRAP